MIFSLVILLLINPVQGLPSFFSPARERISVRGTLMCGDNTAENYRMELFEEDPVWNDLLISTESDENGRFGINAVDEEIGGIEAFLLIHNRCNEEKNCVRLRKIAIPSYMIKRVLVLNNMNLNRTISGEARICDEANARSEVSVRNFEKSHEEVETILSKIGASVEKPVTMKEILAPKNTTSDSVIRTTEPEIDGRKLPIEEPEESIEAMDLFIVTTESTVDTSVLSNEKAEPNPETENLKIETSEPREESTEPTTTTKELTTEKAEARFEAAEPTDETPKSIMERTEPLGPSFETTEPTDGGTPESFTKIGELRTETSELAYDSPESSFATPDPSLDTLKLTIVNPEPIAETKKVKIGTTGAPVEIEGLWNDTSDSSFEKVEERKPKTKTSLVEVPHVLLRFDFP